MVMDNRNIFKKKNYSSHLNGHYIGFRTNCMAYYGIKNDIYGILGVGTKNYGVPEFYAGTQLPTLQITPTTSEPKPTIVVIPSVFGGICGGICGGIFRGIFGCIFGSIFRGIFGGIFRGKFGRILRNI
eukprot:425978_1